MPFDGTTFVENDVIPDILRRARERVADNWVQCTFTPTASKGYCIVTAVDSAIRTMKRETGQPMIGLFDATIDRLCAVLPGKADERGYSLAVYNDAEGRTVEDVLKVFDAAMVGNEKPSLRQW